MIGLKMAELMDWIMSLCQLELITNILYFKTNTCYRNRLGPKSFIFPIIAKVVGLIRWGSR